MEELYLPFLSSEMNKLNFLAVLLNSYGEIDSHLK